MVILCRVCGEDFDSASLCWEQVWVKASEHVAGANSLTIFIFPLLHLVQEWEYLSILLERKRTTFQGPSLQASLGVRAGTKKELELFPIKIHSSECPYLCLQLKFKFQHFPGCLHEQKGDSKGSTGDLRQRQTILKQLHVLYNQVHLSIWDTAGQERFHALGPIYYRDSHGEDALDIGF